MNQKTIDFTENQLLLIELLKKHHTEPRKYTGEPYVNHLIEVANFVAPYEIDAVEIALCHDLLEDTACSETELYEFFMENGYSAGATASIMGVVQELTDYYTTKRFPDLNRTARKTLETQRMGRTSYLAQTVKYCDIMSNTKSIVENDLKFAQVYVQEKQILLHSMNSGHWALRAMAGMEVIKSIQKLALATRHLKKS